MGVGNNNNLIPNSERTPEQLREMTRKGGKKSGEVRRAKKNLRETAELILSGKVKSEKLKKMLSENFGVKGSEQTYYSAMVIAMLSMTLKQNRDSVNAFNAIKDLLNDKTDKKEIALMMNKTVEFIDDVPENDE